MALRAEAMALFFSLLLAGFALAEEAKVEKPIYEESYYKIKAGLAEEYLDLYKRSIYRRIKEHMKAGRILGFTVFKQAYHTEASPWDYKVVIKWRSFSAIGESRALEDELTLKLFGSKEAYEEINRRRWEITERHWDIFTEEVRLE